MTHLIPMTKSATAVDVFRLLLQHVFSRHGVPIDVVSDRDPRFTSHFWKEIFQLLNTKLSMSTAFHPQTDGQTERMNQTVEQVLRHYLNPQQTNWDTCLPFVEFALNNSVNVATGHTPFFLNYGFHPRIPFQQAFAKDPNMQPMVASATEFIDHARRLQAIVPITSVISQNRAKAQADKHRTDIEFHVGDKVLLSTRNLHLASNPTPKFRQRFVGPFTILQRIGNVSYKLDLPATWTIHPVFHISLLKAFHESPQFPEQQALLRPPPLLIDGHKEWLVDQILDERTTRGKREFFIRWTGFGPEDDSWEPWEFVKDAEALDRWEQTGAAQKSNSRPKRQRGRRT
mmetsp:Transcript_11/g.18  ORF Transcript_11/g.18 Transcript_11/m.18 type:complete len:343 (+) Transcript_11:2918-3946(+)